MKTQKINRENVVLTKSHLVYILAIQGVSKKSLQLEKVC